MNKKTSYSKDIPNEIESKTRFIAIRVTFFDGPPLTVSGAVESVFFFCGESRLVLLLRVGILDHAVSKGGRQVFAVGQSISDATST